MTNLLEETKKYYEDMADIEKDPVLKEHYLKQVKAFEARIERKKEKQK